RFFNKNVGWQVDAGFHDRFYDDTTGYGEGGDSNTGLVTVQTGPIYRWPGDVTPWIHFLAGGVSFEGPYHQGYTPGVTFTIGGGADYQTPWFNRHLALRLFEADYEYIHVDHGLPHSV